VIVHADSPGVSVLEIQRRPATREQGNRHRNAGIA